MAYLEKKTIAGRTYYYLTTIKRVGKKLKKTRKYLGTHVPAGFERAKKVQKPALTKKEHRIIEQIKKRYAKKYRIGTSLWKEERERLVSFVYNTNAIEGNELSYEETDSVLLGKRIKAKERDIREAKNMKECIDFIFQYKGAIDEALVLKLHGMEMDGIMPDAGRYRDVDVRVGNYLCPRHEDVPRLMQRFLDWYRAVHTRRGVFELAALVHLKFVRIHSFRDGNGRMARLLMNLILLQKGYPLLNIFNSEKLLYYLVLQKVDATKRTKPFVHHLYGVYVGQYQRYVR